MLRRRRLSLLEMLRLSQGPGELSLAIRAAEAASRTLENVKQAEDRRILEMKNTVEIPPGSRMVPWPLVEEFLGLCWENAKALERETDNGCVYVKSLGELIDVIVSHEAELEVRQFFQAWLKGFTEAPK